MAQQEVQWIGLVWGQIEHKVAHARSNVLIFMIQVYEVDPLGPRQVRKWNSALLFSMTQRELRVVVNLG